MGAPNFWKTFGEALTLSAERRGAFAYLPWFLVLNIGAGFCLGWLALIFDAKIAVPDSIAALASMLVVAGIFGSVSIGCMNQIFATLADTNFASYLRYERAFDQFLAWPQIILLIQMSYLLACAIAIVVACTFNENEFRVFLVSEFGALILYVATKTWNLIDLLRVLAWHRQDYMEQLEEERARQ